MSAPAGPRAGVGAGVPWEHGSDFPLLDFEPAAGATPLPGLDAPLYSTGRTALRALLAHGAAREGWRRLWVPAYYCPDVIPALRAAGPEVRAYPAGPEWSDAPPAAPGDAVLAVNFFGLASGPPPWLAGRRGVALIEDHTHDPGSDWARASQADWCVASLRKTLPVPDGGSLWSPRGHPLPPPPRRDPAHEDTAAEKLAAMALKRAYLAGRAELKPTYRMLFAEAEEALARQGEGAAPAAASAWTEALVRRMPVEKWRRRRADNHATLSALLGDLPAARVLAPADADRAAPAVCTLVLDAPERRDRLRTALIARSVYPAVLWSLADGPHGPVPAGLLDLSRRALALHCDMRYDADDLARVAALVRESLGA
jgi:hypothetical protein